LLRFHVSRVSYFAISTKLLNMPKYDPQKDIPDLSGKVILVTGGKSSSLRQHFYILQPRLDESWPYN
jgi:hypothetical protein